MSTTNPFSRGENSRFAPIATRLTHFTPALWASIFVANLVTTYFIRRYELGFWASLPLGIPGALALFLTVFVEAWHVYRICVVCARKTPLDPERTIAKKRRRLRLLHWVADRQRIYNWTLLVLLVVSFVPYVGGWTFLVLISTMATMSYLKNVHLPLQPWCPQCRGGWGEGGEHEPSPTPDPAAVQTA